MVPSKTWSLGRSGNLLLSSRRMGISPQGGRVAGDEHQFGLALAQGLQGLLVAQAVFAGLHHQRQTGVGALQSLLLFLNGHHVDSLG